MGRDWSDRVALGIMLYRRGRTLIRAQYYVVGTDIAMAHPSDGEKLENMKKLYEDGANLRLGKPRPHACKSLPGERHRKVATMNVAYSEIKNCDYVWVIYL